VQWSVKSIFEELVRAKARSCSAHVGRGEGREAVLSAFAVTVRRRSRGFLGRRSGGLLRRQLRLRPLARGSGETTVAHPSVYARWGAALAIDLVAGCDAIASCCPTVNGPSVEVVIWR